MALDSTGEALLKILRKVEPDEYVGTSEEIVKTHDGAIQNSGIVADGDVVLVPHLSEEELERNVPARGKGMVPVKVPKGVSGTTFYTLLSNAYVLYVTEGGYDNDRLQRRTGIAPGTIATTLASPEFKRALSVRGVVANQSGLTTEQDYAIQKLCDPSDGKTLNQKLKQLGIPYSKYTAWMRQPLFKTVMESHTHNLLHDNNASLVQLAKKAGEGDMAAIKYLHELNGTHDPNRQSAIDAMGMVSLIIEIITKHVKDPVALSGISNDIGQVVSQIKGSTPGQIGK